MSMTNEELLEIVTETAGEYQRTQNIDYELEFPKVSRREGDWCYVIVNAGNRPKRSFEYYDRLSEIERLIDDRTKLHVLLVPAMAEVV